MIPFWLFFGGGFITGLLMTSFTVAPQSNCFITIRLHRLQIRLHRLQIRLHRLQIRLHRLQIRLHRLKCFRKICIRSKSHVNQTFYTPNYQFAPENRPKSQNGNWLNLPTIDFQVFPAVSGRDFLVAISMFEGWNGNCSLPSSPPPPAPNPWEANHSASRSRGAKENLENWQVG